MGVLLSNNHTGPEETKYVTLKFGKMSLKLCITLFILV